jgi:hypothetical protein
MLPGSARPEAKFFHGFAAGSHSIDAVLRQGVALELGQLVLVVRIIEPEGRIYFAGAYCDNLNWG